MLTEYSPTLDRVVVEKLEDPNETKSVAGLIIVGDNKAELQYAKVLAVGPGRIQNGVRIPVEVEVGDTVAYFKDYGTDLKQSDGSVVMLLHEEDIEAIVPEQEQ